MPYEPRICTSRLGLEQIAGFGRQAPNDAGKAAAVAAIVRACLHVAFLGSCVSYSPAVPRTQRIVWARQRSGVAFPCSDRQGQPNQDLFAR